MFYRIAKKEHLAAKKMLLASVEAEKKLRQPGAAFAADQRTEQIQSKADHPTSPRQHSEVAMIKLRMPNGKVLAVILLVKRYTITTFLCRCVHCS